MYALQCVFIAAYQRNASDLQKSDEVMTSMCLSFDYCATATESCDIGSGTEEYLTLLLFVQSLLLLRPT